MTVLENKSYLWRHVAQQNASKCALVANHKFAKDKIKIQDYTIVKKTLSGGTSTVTILSDKQGAYIVKKTYNSRVKLSGRPFNATESFNNEVQALLLLYGQKHFPQLIYYSESQLTIYMNYCGPTASIAALPNNWKQQIYEIYKVMKSRHLYNNDIYINNFCIKDGEISLIDFGFAKHHIDFCFYNLAASDINKATSLKELCALIKTRGKYIYDTLYYCY